MSNIRPIRPTARVLSRRAKQNDQEWLLDQRTSTRRNRKTDKRCAIRESMAPWS